jgi:hypothetical protein
VLFFCPKVYSNQVLCFSSDLTISIFIKPAIANVRPLFGVSELNKFYPELVFGVIKKARLKKVQIAHAVVAVRTTLKNGFMHKTVLL